MQIFADFKKTYVGFTCHKTERSINTAIIGSIGSVTKKQNFSILNQGFQATHICQEFCIWYTGFFVNIAVVLLQAIREEELQAYDAYEGRFGGVEVKTDKVKKEVTKKKGVVDLHFCSAYAFCEM